MPALTPSQTIGPFFHFALRRDGGAELVRPGTADALRLVGTVYDGSGDPVPDAMLEIWQAARSGRYAHPEDRREELALEPGFAGFGRCFTDEAGGYEFLTVRPGPVPAPDGRLQAPHVGMLVFARGLNRQLATRVYFPDELDANATDPVLASIEERAARLTLVGRFEDGALRFDVHLQGDRETAFFDL